MAQTLKKDVICVSISNDFSATCLIESGALEEIEKEYDIVYLCSNSVSKCLSKSIKIRPPNGNIIKKWVDYLLWYLTFFQHFKKTKSLNDCHKSYKISMLSKRSLILLKILTFPVIYNIAILFFERFILGYDRMIYKEIKKINPVIILVPGIPFDSFGLEVVKSAKKNNITSVMLILHWDFFSSKGLLRSVPDFVCVWGKQMYDMATMTHHIPPDKIKVIGVPQYEIYRNEITQLDARKRLRLPIHKKIIFFAGIGEKYDEMEVLQQIDNNINSELSDDILIIYRPHPKQQPRRNEKQFFEYKFKHVVFDPANMNYEQSSSNNILEYYRDLMYAANAFISPFSTMSIEAAFCGKPTLAIGYSDKVHDWKLEYTTIQDHVKPLLNWKNLVVCMHEDMLLASLKKILNINDDNFANEIKKEVSYIIYSDKNSYSKNLLKIVSELH